MVATKEVSMYIPPKGNSNKNLFLKIQGYLVLPNFLPLRIKFCECLGVTVLGTRLEHTCKCGWWTAPCLGFALNT